MQQIKNQLYILSEARAQKEAIRLRKESAIVAATPEEVRRAIRDIELSFVDEEEDIDTKIAELEAQVKTAVLEHGSSVKHAGINAVFSPGRISWDAKSLDGYAINHPELFAFRKEGKPSVALRSQ